MTCRVVSSFVPERYPLAVARSVAAIDPVNRSLERALACARVADLNRGQNITILDLRELTAVFDYFVLATGSSRRQLHAISEDIESTLERDFGDRRLGREGYDESCWILLDFGDVVVHLFDDETRDYYSLEELWAGAKRIPYEPLMRPVTE